MTIRVGRALRFCALLGVLAVVFAACSEETSGTATTTTQVETTTSTTSPPADPALDGPVFRVGLTGRMTTANWWAAVGHESSPETMAVLANTKASLFTLSKPGLALVPALAATNQPSAVSQQGSSWVVEQPMHDNVNWSDGEPVTAHDLAFYFETVREFALGAGHADHFPASVTGVTAVDNHTVRIEFSAVASATEWQTGVAMAPMVPAHFWETHVEAAREAAAAARAGTSEVEARAAVAAHSLTDEDQDNDLTPESVPAEEVEAHRDRIAAEAGRAHLFAVEAHQEPSSGPLVFESWSPGDLAVTSSNVGYVGRGTETVLYSDGSVRFAHPVLGDQVLGGTATGAVGAHTVVGPFVSSVEWHEHSDADEAYAALTSGQVDYVLDLEGMSFRRYNELAGRSDIGLSISPGDGFRFLGFNLRKPPMSDGVFRRAIATVIDKELFAETLFNGTLFPAYTVVHPDLTLFHNADVERAGWSNGAPMATAERYRAAIEMLSDAGYTWDAAPEVVFDEGGNFIEVTPGLGLEMPNGVDVPELSILAGPGSVEDPMRATFALWIEQWLTDLGMVAHTVPVGLDTIREAVFDPETFQDALSWDLQVLGWGQPDIALPGHTLVALFHSRNGVEVGGLNTTGYASSEFDAAADAFVAATSVGDAASWTMEMERIIAEDLPYVTLYRAPVIEGYGSHVEFPLDAMMGGHGSIPMAWPEAVRITR